MASESIAITQSSSPHTPGSSILPGGFSDGTVIEEHFTDGEEAIEVGSLGGSCMQCP